MKQDAHSGKRSEHKPKHVEKGNIVREVKSNMRERANRVFYRARKISEKARINNEILDDINFFEIIDDEINDVIITDLPVSHVETFIKNFDELLDDDLKLILEPDLNKIPKQMELISCLLKEFSASKNVKPVDFVKGFNSLLEQTSDLVIDFPKAIQQIGAFIARAIYDRCMDESFIERQRKRNIGKMARNCLFYAKRLLHGRYFHAVDLSRVWGSYVGLKSLDDLNHSVIEILEYYIDDGDEKKLLDSLKEMDVPHFHHAFIREALLLMIGHENKATTEKMQKMFKILHKEDMITPNQIEMGFQEVLDNMDDLKIDIPHAEDTISKFANEVKDFIPVVVLEKINKE